MTDLFGAPPPAPASGKRASRSAVAPAAPDARLLELAAALHERYSARLHLGTSSWYFPGWAGLVWAGQPSQPTLSRHGLEAYAQHPLLNTVSLDRAFYRPVDTATYARLASQVGPDFRFVVKAAALVCDATLRDPANGRAMLPNPQFLDPATTLAQCVRPAVDGLGDKLGVLLFQISPLPAELLVDLGALHARFAALFDAVAAALPAGVLVALEPRDPELLTPTLARLLKERGLRCCLGLHDRMPAVEDQLAMQRALWPGDLVCRWNLQRGLRYTQARERWEPFDRIQAPDPATREALARVMAGTLKAGRRVFVTINNKAEGSAPLSVIALAEALLALG
ncbi:MAG: DUF72 domain-containing protein [Rubrivivax sp.]